MLLNGIPQVPAELQGPGKRPLGRQFKLRPDPTILAVPQLYVCDLNHLDRPWFLLDTGATASCLPIALLSNDERHNLDSQAHPLHHVLAVNGDNIKVLGSIARTETVQSEPNTSKSA